HLPMVREQRLLIASMFVAPDEIKHVGKMSRLVSVRDCYWGRRVVVRIDAAGPAGGIDDRAMWRGRGQRTRKCGRRDACAKLANGQSKDVACEENDAFDHRLLLLWPLRPTASANMISAPECP